MVVRAPFCTCRAVFARFASVRISIRGKDFSQDEECSACVKIPLCLLHECLPICEMNLRGKDQIKEGLH